MPASNIFLDPEYSKANPDEVIFKIAFNEAGNVGLITSYHEVVEEIIFTGISLSTSDVWVAKMPLALREEIGFKGLVSAAQAIKSALQQHVSHNALNELLSKFFHIPPKGSFSLDTNFPASNNSGMSPESFFGSPSNLGFSKNPMDNVDENIKFNFDDFLKEFNIDDDIPPPDDNGE
tara:strand:+ start:566 stop:1096 length:531 start_codon:yes stop_codon:yes gene_type:complete